jgi:hypothetical protein
MLTHTIGWGLAGAVITILTGVISPAVVSLVGDEAAEVVDLSTLSDGETRTFGSGEHAITATRKGESVTIQLPGDEGRGKTVDCTLGGSGGCFAFTTGDSAGIKIVAVDAEGDDKVRRHVEVVRIGEGDGNVVADHEAQVLVLEGDAAGDAQWQSLIEIPGIHGLVMQHAGNRVVRCPEGDTTMRLDKDDTSTYTCPRHNVALEPLEVRGGVHKIVIRDEDVQ